MAATDKAGFVTLFTPACACACSPLASFPAHSRPYPAQHRSRCQRSDDQGLHPQSSSDVDMPTEAPRQLSTHHQGYEVSVEEEGRVQRREAPADRSPQWLSGLASEDHGVAAGLMQTAGRRPPGCQQSAREAATRRPAMATLLGLARRTRQTEKASSRLHSEPRVGRAVASAVGALILRGQQELLFPPKLPQNSFTLGLLS